MNTAQCNTCLTMVGVDTIVPLKPEFRSAKIRHVCQKCRKRADARATQAMRLAAIRINEQIKEWLITQRQSRTKRRRK